MQTSRKFCANFGHFDNICHRTRGKTVGKRSVSKKRLSGTILILYFVNKAVFPCLKRWSRTTFIAVMSFPSFYMNNLISLLGWLAFSTDRGTLKSICNQFCKQNTKSLLSTSARLSRSESGGQQQQRKKLGRIGRRAFTFVQVKVFLSFVLSPLFLFRTGLRREGIQRGKGSSIMSTAESGFYEVIPRA